MVLYRIDLQEKITEIAHALKFRLIIAILLCGLLNTYEAYATDMSKLTISHQALIAVGDDPVRVLDVAPAYDGGLIIAGRAGGAAWAAKTDKEGKLIWNYLVDESGQGLFDAEFSGIAPMQDGSVYLCGFKPRHADIYSPAILTRIDPQGHKIKEQFLIPKDSPTRGMARLLNCIPSGDGIVAIGIVYNVFAVAEGGRPPQGEQFYLIIKADATGNLLWEKHIPMRDDLQVPEFATLLPATESGVVFSMTHGPDTKLIRLANNGDIISQKSLPGRFQLIQPASSDGILQAVGSYAADKNEVLTVLNLDDALGEISRTQRNSFHFLIRIACRLRDRSLLLFGSGFDMFGQIDESQIIHLMADLSAKEKIDLPRNQAPYLDSGSIWGAGPAGGLDEFVSARGLSVAHDPGDNSPAPFPNEFWRGVELDFVRAK